MEDFMVNGGQGMRLRDAVFALHMVGSDDIGRWEGTGTPFVTANRT